MLSALKTIPAAAPEWWPELTGDVMAIVACGPSAKTADLAPLRGRVPVMAIKEAVDLCDFARIVYGCDKPWWVHRRGLPMFRGLKLSHQGFDGVDVHRVDVKPYEDRLLFDRLGEVGAGGNSGFQALNLAVQFGAKKVLLIGFDMDDRAGVHFYGRNYWMGANNPDRHNFERWRRAFESAAKQLVGSVEVFNSSPFSALTCFPRVAVAEALRVWKCL